MVNNVIGVVNYVIAARPSLRNFMIADRVSMGPAVVDPEVVRLEVRPADALTPTRRALRDAIAHVRGPEQVGESDDWTPHVSVSYSNSTGPMKPYLDALVPPLEPVPVEISDVQLIILGRDTHLPVADTSCNRPRLNRSGSLGRLECRSLNRYA